MRWGQKSVLLNNAYLFASREQWEIMNKKTYHRQTAIIFCKEIVWGRKSNVYKFIWIPAQ